MTRATQVKYLFVALLSMLECNRTLKFVTLMGQSGTDVRHQLM